jgi:hypothetical protein
MAGISSGRAVQASEVVSQIERPLSIFRFLRSTAASIFSIDRIGSPVRFGNVRKLPLNYDALLGSTGTDNACFRCPATPVNRRPSEHGLKNLLNTGFPRRQVFDSHRYAWVQFSLLVC